MEEASGSLWNSIEPLLLEVERPSRYTGGEWNAPAVREGGVRVVLAYPDVYEIGISNLGLAILQEVVNGMEGAGCERVYSPWLDMEREMRAAGVPLFSLESHRAVSGCDIFGISIPHELTYTNILNLIDLAGLPLLAADRSEGPLVVGGGCGAANPEPVAQFFDLIVLGDGEEVMGELVRLVAEQKAAGSDRGALLAAAGRLPGVYRPSAYSVDHLPDGRIGAIRADEGAPQRVSKRLVDPDRWLLPRRPIVPFCEAVHDRLNVELFRGCTRGCRFCQAGMICRPVRERATGEVVQMVDELSGTTGYEEVSLCSLSSSDYTRIKDASERVGAICRARKMVLSLPSLRMDGFSAALALELDSTGRGGLTFAPEAGTERLRRVINKLISERDMIDAVIEGVRGGRRRMKLYFMIGLPTETDADVEAIAVLVFRLRDAVRAEGLQAPGFNISVSTFVPKPHTPFQWSAQDDTETVRRKQGILQGSLRARGIKLSWHDREMSMVESLLARGDRRLAAVVQAAWASGERFDNWSEHFDDATWQQALTDCGVEAAPYYRERDPDEIFPWDHLDFGLDRAFLFGEYRRALAGETTADCRGGECSDCGVCDSLATEHHLTGSWN